MNTIRRSARGSGLKRISAVVAAALITAGLAAAGTVPAHDGTTGRAPAATGSVGDPVLGDGSRDAAPSGLMAKELPGGPKIAVDGVVGPKTSAASQAVSR